MQVTDISGDVSPDPDFLLDSIREILTPNELCSIATVSPNGTSHINTAFYALDEQYRLYVLTPPETVHGQNIANNAQIALDVHDSHQNWIDEKQGLQINATAENLSTDADRSTAENLSTDADRSAALECYTDRFAAMADVAETLAELAALDSVFYRITPNRIKVFDEPRFGTENWVTVATEFPENR